MNRVIDCVLVTLVSANLWVTTADAQTNRIDFNGLKEHPAIVGWEIFTEPEGMTPQFG